MTAIALLVGVSSALAQAATTPTPAATQSKTSSGGTTTIYPIYVFAPVLGADVNLPPGPDLPPCDSCNTEERVTSGLSGAYMGAVHIENNRIFVDAAFLYAGMTADATSKVAKLEADTSFGTIVGGVRVVDALFVEAGTRRTGLTLKATIKSGSYEWKSSQWTSVIGTSYNPQLTPTLKLYVHYDYAGVENDHLSTSTFNGRLEWEAAKHFVLTGGYGWLHMNLDGTIRNKDIRLNQTLHGPILGIGFTF